MGVRGLLKRLSMLRERDVAAKMRRDWDQRARENARHYVATLRTDWTDADFFASGALSFENNVAPDLDLICKGRSASAIRMLEIGCGAGRMTRRFSEVMGSVEAVDVSPEMAARAQAALKDRSNARIQVSNGVDLSLFPDAEFDFVYSDIVFQHIPRKAIVRKYVREVGRVIRPGGVFKFQVQGTSIEDRDADTWLGVGFTEKEMLTMADEFGFEVLATTGAGTQYFWLTFIRKTS